VYSISSDSSRVKGAISTTFLTEKINEKLLPKCQEISYTKDIKVEVSHSHTHTSV